MFGNRVAINRFDCSLDSPVIAVQPLAHETQCVGWNMQSAIGEMELDEGGKKSVVGMADPGDGGNREPSLEIRQARRPGGRHGVGDHNQRTTRILGLVPGVEQLFLVALVGLVEQPPAGALDETACKKRSAGSSWARQDRRLHGPHAELSEMFERITVGIGDDKPGVAFVLRPVERERDLVGSLLHGWALGGWFGGCAVVVGGCGAGAAGAWTGGGGIAGGLSESEWIFTTDPAASTTQPRPPSAAAS